MSQEVFCELYVLLTGSCLICMGLPGDCCGLPELGKLPLLQLGPELPPERRRSKGTKNPS